MLKLDENALKAERGASASREFRETTLLDAENCLQNELANLVSRTPDEEIRKQFANEFTGFVNLFNRFLIEEGKSIKWEKIEPLPKEAVVEYSSIEQNLSKDVIKHMLNKLVVVKLNGGLGTSMGCHGPKSIISVRSDLNFLDLTVQQIEHLNKTYDANVPLILMNSFNTNKDIRKIVPKYKGFKIRVYMFNQSCYPRLSKDSLLPIATNLEIDNNLDAWYPPGHGDFYESFKRSGLLQKFIDEGREYCFLSNIDNLGATVDIGILNYIVEKKLDFIMEITDKTRADVKGGTLINYDNKLRLLEIAQVPKDHVDEFKSVNKFKYFNTNNIWASLEGIYKVVVEKKLNMEIIPNYKHLSNGLNIIQLETAVGAAMKSFEKACGLNVPRSRFLPVKKTSDLMLVMSNLYILENGSLKMSPKRIFPSTPLVKLGDLHFEKVKECLSRFDNIPDMLELDHLTVSGDVTFGKNVSLKGTVIIIANHGDRIDIPSGSQIENKIISGNLRIFNH